MGLKEGRKGEERETKEEKRGSVKAEWEAEG